MSETRQPALNSIRPAIEELERAFHRFAPLFGREMPLPVITVQYRGRKNALGWFSDHRWGNGPDGDLPEINLCAESLARSVSDIAGTLLHEMVHYANALDGISDCTVRQYHNRWFRQRCDEIGLVCERMAGRGWAQTSLSPELRAMVDEIQLDANAFGLFRHSAGAKKAATKMKKWRCGCTNVRAATDVAAVCHKCGLEFTLQNCG
jgi:hypothetical protein